MNKKTQNRLRKNAFGFAIYATVATILVLTLASFAASPAKAGQENFGPNDDGKTVELTPGTVITVELPENPSTGYSWNYNIDSSVAEIIEDSFVSPDNPIPGAGGMRLLKLKIVGGGDLKMSYERSWEKQPIDTFTLTFKI